MISILIILSIFSVRSYRQDIQKTFQDGESSGETHSQTASKSFMEALLLLSTKNTQEQTIKKNFAKSVPYFLMFFVTILTLVSGVRYIITNHQVFWKTNHQKY